MDDETSIVDAVATALRYEGFEVEEAATGREALSAVARFDPDLIVLDWMLPDIDGIEVGRRLREQGQRNAILFLTAKDAVENKVEALRAGGDDYVTKPFSLAEVVARVQAILRRTGGDLPGDVLRYADLTLDESRHEVFRGDTRLQLTATEFALLRFFLLNPRRVLSKGQILQNVWRYDFRGNSNVVETYVSYLRRKLDADGAAADQDRAPGGLHARRVLVSKRLSLRARLLLAVVVLAAIGLVAANVATYSTLSSYLLDRTDSTLDQTAETLRRPGPGGGIRSAPPGTFVQVRSLDGDTVVATFSGATLPGASVPAPKLPGTVKPPTLNRSREAVRYFTVGGAHGGPEYRVRASIAQDDEAMLLVASSLRDVNSTLHRLLAIELVVTALVLAAIAGLGLWLVRLGLRPLDAIGETASAIAAGDLSRRVERAEERTEVGRLGLALNSMLARIESSFRAQEASERKLRRFVADASHELRTPLSAVRAYSELYDRGAAERPDDLERSMQGISRESERMSVLVEDLLLLARLDDGRPLEREPVELDEVVGEAVETAQAVDPERAIELHAEPATVLGDRVRLRQIVDNLLANVRAHTPAGTPASVSVRRKNGSAEIAVTDAGPGLDEEHLEHLFERFYRADASRSRASGGVGLGLAIVAAVAEAHGGTASASSRPGEGTTVAIALPLARDAG